MKLAILGNSPLALEAALRFHLHGAALTWYIDQNESALFASPRFPSEDFTTDLGIGILREINQRYAPQAFNWSEWSTHYQKPLIDFLRVHQEVKTDEVVSVSKRFLAPGEQISGRSRFLDLFRVIFHVDPKNFIEEQRESNPSTYKRLSEEFVNSLASSIEMYQDYDLILDLRTDFERASVAISGRALGEGRESSRVSYGLEALNFSKNIPTEVREIALIGSDSLAAEILISLGDWMSDQRSGLFLVTSEESPFEKFLRNANEQTAFKLHQILSSLEEEFKDEADLFSSKLRQWQELDQFVQAKVPKPAEPIPRLNFFSGHNVTAIDELIDRKRMFVTLEKPEFRFGKKHPENNNLDLKTIGVDHILVSHAKKNMDIIQLDSNEQGYFNLTPVRANEKKSWENDLARLEGIEDEIFKLFSPVDSH
jgi:hypothetical protein